MMNTEVVVQSKNLISVIVPVYKTEAYLGKCVDSILAQTYPYIEVLLIEDGSPDRCGDICDEYTQKDSRVKTFHITNRGISAARNFGLRVAKGEYIGFVDSDDWIEPEMYSTLYRGLTESGADVSVCGFRHEFKDSFEAVVPDDITLDKDDAVKCVISSKVSSYVWNRLFRKKLFSNVMFPEGHVYEDVVVTYKLVLAAETVRFIPDILYHYRHSSTSISNSHTMERLIDFWDASRERYLFFENNEKFNNDAEFMDALLLHCAGVISTVWMNAYATGQWKDYIARLREMSAFAREEKLAVGKRNWPVMVRYGVIMSRSVNGISLFLAYCGNRVRQKLKGEQLF